MCKPTTAGQVSLALGRLFAIGGRPFQEGDHEEYERCRVVIMASQSEGTFDWTPNHIRDRNRGAPGQ